MITFLYEAVATFGMAVIGGAVLAFAGSMIFTVLAAVMATIDWLEARSKVDE
jgi:hypothetical protein